MTTMMNYPSAGFNSPRNVNQTMTARSGIFQNGSLTVRGVSNTDGDESNTKNHLAKEFAMLRDDGDLGQETLDKTADVVDFKCNNSSNGGPLKVAIGGPNKAIRSFEAET